MFKLQVYDASLCNVALDVKDGTTATLVEPPMVYGPVDCGDMDLSMVWF